MLLNELFIHPESLEKLRGYLSSGRLSHAMMMSGPTGSGVLAAALAASRFLLCKTPKDRDACNACPDCKMSAAWVHPDWTFTFPTYSPTEYSHELIAEWRQAITENPYMEPADWAAFATREENKLPNITAKEAHNIVQRISKKAYGGGRKVVLIWGAELLSKEGNVLLKAIEEPPENTFFILAASAPEKILITIYSRCQQFRIIAPETEQVEAYLQRLNPELNAEQASSMALFADSNFSVANWLSTGQETGNVQSIRSWMLCMYRNDMPACIGLLDKIQESGREGIKNYLISTLAFLRNAVLAGLQLNNMIHLKAEELEIARNVAKITSPAQISRMEKEINDAVYHIERNANPRIVLLNLSLRIRDIFRAAQKAAA